MNFYYILDGHQPVPERNILKWCAWMQSAETQVALDDCNGVKVSTVFLGTNHNPLDAARPLLFETMIFGGKLNHWQWRYSTWEQAEAGHRDILLLVQDTESDVQAFNE